MSVGDEGQLQEVEDGLLTTSEVDELVAQGALTRLRAGQGDVIVGPSALMKVNTSIGCSNLAAIGNEHRKIAEIGALEYAPDLMMDLSIVRTEVPLYKHIQEELGVPVGTLPHYLALAPGSAASAQQILDEIEAQAAGGVAWMTLHVAVTREIYEIAYATRGTAMTSRGGGLVLDEMFFAGQSDGVFLRHFSDVLRVLAVHGVALSLGTTFRPATTRDALDEAHVRELRLQAELTAEATRFGVPVMLEAVGHMTLDKVPVFTALVREEMGICGPIMTLGPIATDAAVGEDHVANAIGAAALGIAGGTDVINSVTREEHTGRVPSMDSILEGLRAARVAAHSVNIARFPALDGGVDRDLAERRARNYTCVVEGGLFSRSARTRFAMGCSRCAAECPLLVNRRAAEYVKPAPHGLGRV
jgi:phosphomethylpyrimidine synthase